MSKLNLLYRVFVSVITLALLSCGEKMLPPVEVQQPEIIIDDTLEIEARQKKYEEGIAAMSIRNYSDARRIFTEFVRENPEMSGAYVNLALIHFESKEYDQAMKRIDQAIALNSRQSQAYNLRAQLLIIDGKILDARDDLLKAIEINPEYSNAQYNLALIYDVYLQDVKLALPHYEMYMSLIKVPDETTGDWVEQLKRTLNNG